jgi:hypothetical protein
MSYKPGDTRIGGFTTQRFDTGAATDADSLPAVTVTKNGADQGGASVTVSKLDTGRYKYSYTIDAGWAAGDRIQDFVAATVNSVAGKACVGDFVLDKRVNDALDASNQVTAASVQGNVTGSVGSVVSYGSLVADVATAVWAASGRTLSSFGSLASECATAVWGASTRTLSTFGTLVADIATAVWGATVRALTDKVGFQISGTKTKLDDLTDVTAAQVKAALETEGGLLAWLRDVDEGDIYIDTTTTPWQLEIRLKGTDEALITKELRQVDGVGVTSASHLVALHTEPAP